MSPSRSSASPVKMAAAVITAVLLIVLFWQFKFGAWALLLIPIMGLYLANVHLGGRLNDPPIDGIRRIRDALERRA